MILLTAPIFYAMIFAKGADIMLKRKFYDTLLSWKKQKPQTCLLVKGARQIGKTFIIEKFGKENYKSYIYINFIETPQAKIFLTVNCRLNQFIPELL